MTRAGIQRLRAEIASDLATFRSRTDELRGLDIGSGGPAVCAQAAVALHHLYGAVEAALSRVARLLEGSVPEGADWHQQLISTMALEIPTVRPRVLSDASRDALRKLLAFRHFFRHAYSASWDTGQLLSLREAALGLDPQLASDMAALDLFLSRIGDALGR